MSRRNWDINDWKGRCSELSFEVKRLQKDSERLEWLVSRDDTVQLIHDEEWNWFRIIEGGGLGTVIGKGIHGRHAIDEAMENE